MPFSILYVIPASFNNSVSFNELRICRYSCYPGQGPFPGHYICFARERVPPFLVEDWNNLRRHLVGITAPNLFAREYRSRYWNPMVSRKAIVSNSVTNV